MMKRMFCGLVMAATLAGCARQTAELNIVAPQMEAGTEVVLAKLAVNQLLPVDTLTLQGGSLQYKMEALSETPDFFYLLKGEERLASFVAAASDRIEIRLEDGKVAVTGSEEATLFQQQEADFDAAQAKFVELSLLMDRAREAGDKAAQERYQVELGRYYVKFKQQSIRFLMEHPYSLVQIPVLYRSLGDGLSIFSDHRDGLYFARVYDSLRVTYPNSPYLHAIKEEAELREQLLRLNEKLGQATEADFPDLSMQDRNGEVKNLSDLRGKVIVLSFWTATEPSHKLFNNELKALYEKYHKRGLEIYQVALDTDKTMWAQAVKEQQLPWVSVCDGMGRYSVAAAYYNIGSIPAMYIIDRDGNIRPEKNEFDPEKLERVIKRLL